MRSLVNKRALIFALVVLCGCSIVPGCGGGSQTTNLLLNIVILLITRSAGGVVRDNNTSLTIPPDSLQANTTIEVQPASNLPQPPVDLSMIAETAYSYGPASTTFSPSATITVTYNPANVPAEVQPATLGLYAVSATRFTLVPNSSVNTTSNTVTAPVSALGTYVVMGVVPVVVSQ